VKNFKKSVIPAQAGIQQTVDMTDHVALDPGLRRGDGVNFNMLIICPA
jgi:hypothetical protein